MQITTRLQPVICLLQAAFNAGARLCVRELRTTESTDIIMVYSGTMQCLLALLACMAVPGSLAAPQHWWQALLLLLTGATSAWLHTDDIRPLRTQCSLRLNSAWHSIHLLRH